MKKSHRNIVVLAAAAAVVALGAAAAMAGGTSTRLNDTVIVGLGGSSTKTITFDAGVSPNPLISATSSKTIGINTTSPAGTLGVAYPDASSDVTTFATRGGSVSGIQRWKLMPPSGATPQFEIDADFSSSPNVLEFQSDTNTLLVLERSGLVRTVGNFSTGGNAAITGAATVTGATTLNGATTVNATGGNVPHSCTTRTASSTVTATVSCSAGEIVTGGGCDNSPGSISQNHPASGTSWVCAQTGGGVSITAYAICCSY